MESDPCDDVALGSERSRNAVKHVGNRQEKIAGEFPSHKDIFRHKVGVSGGNVQVIPIEKPSADQVSIGLWIGIRENPAADPDMSLEFFADRPDHRNVVGNRMEDVYDFDDFPEGSGGKSHGGCLPFVGENYGDCIGAIPSMSAPFNNLPVLPSSGNQEIGITMGKQVGWQTL